MQIEEFGDDGRSFIGYTLSALCFGYTQVIFTGVSGIGGVVFTRYGSRLPLDFLPVLVS
jgi:hypothetical protein